MNGCYKTIALFTFGITILFCTPTQRPLKNGQGYVAVPAGEKHYRIKTRKARRNLLERPRRAAMPRFALGEIYMADQLG